LVGVDRMISVSLAESCHTDWTKYSAWWRDRQKTYWITKWSSFILYCMSLHTSFGAMTTPTPMFQPKAEDASHLFRCRVTTVNL